MAPVRSWDSSPIVGHPPAPPSWTVVGCRLVYAIPGGPQGWTPSADARSKASRRPSPKCPSGSALSLREEPATGAADGGVRTASRRRSLPEARSAMTPAVVAATWTTNWPRVRRIEKASGPSLTVMSMTLGSASGFQPARQYSGIISDSETPHRSRVVGLVIALLLGRPASAGWAGSPESTLRHARAASPLLRSRNVEPSMSVDWPNDPVQFRRMSQMAVGMHPRRSSQMAAAGRTLVVPGRGGAA